MDPQSNDTPGLRLPQPSMHPGPLQSAPGSPVIAPSQQPLPEPLSAPGSATQPYQAQQPVPQAAFQAPAVASSAPVSQQPAAPSTNTVAMEEGSESAADEEWIAKAKAATEQYRSDPYALSNALGQIKADYMMARHGKMIKTNNPNS